jgi:hypothetical protein
MGLLFDRRPNLALLFGAKPKPIVAALAANKSMRASIEGAFDAFPMRFGSKPKPTVAALVAIKSAVASAEGLFDASLQKPVCSSRDKQRLSQPESAIPSAKSVAALAGCLSKFKHAARQAKLQNNAIQVKKRAALRDDGCERPAGKRSKKLERDAAESLEHIVGAVHETRAQHEARHPSSDRRWARECP